MGQNISGFYFFGEAPKETSNSTELEIYFLHDNITYFDNFINKRSNIKHSNIIESARLLLKERKIRLTQIEGLK